MNNIYLNQLLADFQKISKNTTTVEAIRDKLRRQLQTMSNDKFPWGCFTSVQDVLEYILQTDTITVSSILTCPHNTTYLDFPFNNCVITAGNSTISSILDWISNFREPSQYRCDMCNDNIEIVNRICNIVPILAFQFPGCKAVIDSNFTININDQNITSNLRGIINYHYTSSMINRDGLVLFHDGLQLEIVLFLKALSVIFIWIHALKGRNVSCTIVYTQQLDKWVSP